MMSLRMKANQIWQAKISCEAFTRACCKVAQETIQSDVQAAQTTFFFVSSLEAIALRLETIVTRLEAIATRLEAISKRYLHDIFL